MSSEQHPYVWKWAQRISWVFLHFFLSIQNEFSTCHWWGRITHAPQENYKLEKGGLLLFLSSEELVRILAPCGKLWWPCLCSHWNYLYSSCWWLGWEPQLFNISIFQFRLQMFFLSQRTFPLCFFSEKMHDVHSQLCWAVPQKCLSQIILRTDWVLSVPPWQDPGSSSPCSCLGSSGREEPTALLSCSCFPQQGAASIPADALWSRVTTTCSPLVKDVPFDPFAAPPFRRDFGI